MDLRSLLLASICAALHGWAAAQPTAANATNAGSGCSCGSTEFHSGEDWSGAEGSVVHAVERGRVVALVPKAGVTDDGSGTAHCGRYIVLRHAFPNGKLAYTRYAQLGSIESAYHRPIHIGDIVRKGQALGRIGKQGSFHFEVRVDTELQQSWTTATFVAPSEFDFDAYGKKY